MSLGLSYAGFRTGFPFPLRTKSISGAPFEAWDGSTLSGFEPAASSGAEVYGPGTRRPIGLTIGQLAFLFWRIKILHYTYDCTVNWLDGAEDPQTADYGPDSGLLSPLQQNPGSWADVSREVSLDNESRESRHYAQDILSGWGSSGISIFYDDVWKIGESYYPSMQLSIGGFFANVGTGSSGGNLGDSLTGLPLDFCGFGNLPLRGSPDLFTVDLYPPYSGSGTLALAPYEFWTYGGKYDSVTGEPV